MSEANQFAISQALGSKMRPVRPARFGGFGLLQTTADIVRAQHGEEAGSKRIRFTYDHDRLICKAFEEVRQGASPDAILWDRLLQQQFTQRCRERGVDAPDAQLNRRLINIRKNKKRYERHGIRLSPTTKKEPHPSIVAQFGHVIEFALVWLRYRYGASIDDILLDPYLSDQFEHMTLDIAPQLSPQDVRLGALYIRKSRHIPKREQSKLAQLDLARFDHQCSPPQPLADVKVEEVPASPGIIELSEENRFLYIARNECVGPTIERLQSGHAFGIVARGFWKPDINTIVVQYAIGRRFADVPIAKWERRLIQDRQPLFNWPINKTVA